MLILSRKTGEKIMIGENISIMICEIKGNQARIGIDAPKDISVHRKEIYDRIMEEEELKKNNLVDSIIDKVKGLIS